MNNVKVRLGDLREAAGKIGPRRLPRGFRGTISRTTELKPDPNGISVETPYLEISVAATGRWEKIVSVDAKLLDDTLTNLKRLWAGIGGGNAEITLSTDGGALEFYWSDGKSTRKHSIPLLPSP